MTTSDADALFLSPTLREAFDLILHGIKEKKGLIVVTGEHEVGKATLLRRYLQSAAPMKQKTILVFNPNLTFEWLLITILDGLGAQAVGGEAAAMVNQLRTLLIAEHRTGGTIVLIIDEAQCMPVKTLENLLKLSDLETSNEKLIQMVLMGQPQLDTMLDRHELHHLRARIAARGKILPPTNKESLTYIRHVPWSGSRYAVTLVASGVLTLAIILYLHFGMKVSWPNHSMASPDRDRSQEEAFIERSTALVSPDVTINTASVFQIEARPAAGAVTRTSASSEILEKAELTETARLLAVLLDAGRVVVGKAQPTINNPRLEDKGFSSSVFEDQLRKEFLARTGNDLRDLAPAAMPEHAKPLLVRLAFFMQKAVQEVQPEINKKGIGYKGFIPATFATRAAERFSKDMGLKVRQIGPPGIDPRNPNNKPDEQEEQALLSIQKTHPRIGDHVVEQQLPNNAVRVLLPLFYNKQCLVCHGKPKGEVDISGYGKEGFKEGDLGGAISVILFPDNKLLGDKAR